MLVARATPNLSCLDRIMASPIQYRVRVQSLSQSAGLHVKPTPLLQHGTELDDHFSGLDAGSGLMTVAGFGSLLSGRSSSRVHLLEERVVDRRKQQPQNSQHCAIAACRTQCPDHLPQPTELQARTGG